MLGSTDTDIVPVARIPLDASTAGPIFQVDVLTGQVEHLPPLPTRQFLATPQLVANSNGIVVSTTMCDQPPVSGFNPVTGITNGYQCAGNTGTNWAVYLYRSEQGWRQIGPTTPIFMGSAPTMTLLGDIVTISTDGSDTADIEVGPTSVRHLRGPTGWPGDHLASDTSNGVTVDEATGRASYTTDPAAPRSSVALSRFPPPFNQLADPPSDLFDFQFFSSGPYIAALEDSTGALADESKGAVSVAVIDLRHPSAPPRVLGQTEAMLQLNSGANYVGWEDGDLHVRSPGGKVIADVLRQQALYVTSARHGLLALDHDPATSAPVLTIVHGS
jgi:hypothetical protein